LNLYFKILIKHGHVEQQQGALRHAERNAAWLREVEAREQCHALLILTVYKPQNIQNSNPSPGASVLAPHGSTTLRFASLRSP
jgi:hypothetical protein